MTSMISQTSLPQDSPAGQRYVSVYALHAGSIFLPDSDVFEDSIGKDGGLTVPSFAFLIDHEVHGKFMFDLGLRKGGKGYPPAWDETLIELKVDCSKNVADLLQEGGVQPSSINSIIYRYSKACGPHLHFDHVGDLTPFPHAELIVGADTAALMQQTYPGDPTSLWPEWPAGQKVRYLHFGDADAPARPIAPFHSFARALDLYGDGSFYLLDAPGHLPGHLAALARVSPNAFILLAGDCCHNRQCYTPGVRLVSRENYHDIETARDTVERLKRMNGEPNVVLVLAHERERLEDSMPLFPQRLNEWVTTEIVRKRHE
ncbi:predicted protein [Postia placenta Mad-698-R]|uniref:Metallo-beta-lactamase domain-containing protein n=1 Tax=Postia placenta MAD-698-R-SB12 TaxID=670580 RepID=A0A1X6MYG6_9APHY|nr:hypothetical protein POSPLADRAFT_1147058 [Postia placenta MAD-698-R-SB12]EED80741.1 predicted protein [Postia placenta Mad-698-R]OSX61256.1 hypothetical protein POSPLADRAFT_1147058 [Postia placenta MAD-698-R-SB12]